MVVAVVAKKKITAAAADVADYVPDDGGNLLNGQSPSVGRSVGRPLNTNTSRMLLLPKATAVDERRSPLTEDCVVFSSSIASLALFLYFSSEQSSTLLYWRGNFSAASLHQLGQEAGRQAGSEGNQRQAGNPFSVFFFTASSSMCLRLASWWWWWSSELLRSDNNSRCCCCT